ncbi:MAG: hypothetical protein H6558_23110 [Lewinellaceae bacterium]|nr:hypothetical protein [Lewinellaceae bacterium]
MRGYSLDLEYCYHWIPETGLDDPESARPNATPQETTTYQVFVTTSQGELVAEDEVTVTVNTVEVRILPEYPSLCYRMIPASNTRRNADTEGNRPTGISCTQDYVDLSLDGVFVTANWSNGSSGDNIVVDEPGFYSVIVTDENGCEASAQVEVGMCTATPLAITADSPQLCEDTLTLSVAEGFASYNWSDDRILPELQVIDTGTYSITVEDVNGCIGVDSFTVIACNPIVDIDVYNGFYDWVTNTTWSGGQLIPDNLELSMGAVTIANLKIHFMREA